MHEYCRHVEAEVVSNSKNILVGFSSSIEGHNGRRKWRILTPLDPVLATTTAARGGVGGGVKDSL